MQKFGVICLAVLFAVLAAFVTVKMMVPDQTGMVIAEANKESTYEREMRTGELRCGYFSWKPAFIKDPNTGEMSGIFMTIWSKWAVR